MQGIQRLQNVSSPRTRGFCARRRLGLGCALLWVGLVVPIEGWAYMDHGGRISRDFAVVDANESEGGEDLVFLAWGGGGSKKERITLFALCADGDCGGPAAPNANQAPAALFEDTTRSRLKDIDENEEDFCDTSICWHSSSNSAADEVGDRCASSPACYWAVEIPGSRGNISHSPPVVDEASNRVFVASVDEGGGGSIWAFDLHGNLQGMFRPKLQHRDPNKKNKPRYRNHITAGFYARPAVFSYPYTFNGDEKQASIVLAPGLKNAYLYVLDGRDLATVIDAFPISEDLDSSGGKVRFEPILEDVTPGGCGFPNSEGGPDCQIRVSVGAENGGKKRGLYVYKVDISAAHSSVAANGVSFSNVDPETSPRPTELHVAVLHEDLPAVLGGDAILEKTRDDGSLNGATKRFLVMTLSKRAGVALLDLTAVEAALQEELLNDQNFGRVFEKEQADPFIAIHPVVEQTHRTRPMVHFPCLEVGENYDCDPEVYIGQKGGGDHAGGRVYRFRFPQDPPLSGPWEDWSALGEIAEGPRWESVLERASPSSASSPWPDCLSGGTGITTTSWSSPFAQFVPSTLHDNVDQDTSFVFVGSSHESNGAGGVYRLSVPAGKPNPGCASLSQDPEDAWFDYDLSRGWRTTAIATSDDTEETGTPLRLHLGTSNERFFTLDLVADGGPGLEENLTLWCYNLETGQQYGPAGAGGSLSWQDVCEVGGD